MDTNYKNKSIYLGFSDSSSLTINSEKGEHALNFGEDGSYRVPPHYTLSHTFQNWIKIYDDDGLVTTLHSKNISIYQAGNFGCIIKLS